nr:integrase, catalytic region, zinc finger, CCHC-type, peptidase aspartic, catalytic [Tanacetum cinerariifolium]
MVEEVTSLKKDFKQKENKYLEDFLDMKSLKEKVEDRLLKQDQSLQTVHILCRPKHYYNKLNKNLIKPVKRELHQLGSLKGKDVLNKPRNVISRRALDSQITQLTEKVTVLQAQNDLFRAENEKIKQHYKELYDSIKITRAKHIEQVTALTTENVNLKAKILNYMNSVTKDHLKPTVLEPDKYAIDVEPIPSRLRNNRQAHLDYLRHLKETVETIREIVKEAKVNNVTRQIVTHKHVVKLNTQKTNVPVPPSTGVNRCTDASGSHPRSNTKKNRILPAKGINKMKVKEHPRTNKSHLRTTNRVDSSSRSKSTVVQTVLWYLDSGCSKHITGDRSQLMNLIKKFIGTVRFKNDHFGAIMGYRDYVIGDSVISRVYYVEGLGHNLFFVGQFCDSDLEVAFRKHSCYVRDTNALTEYYERVGIFHQKTVPRTPQQNGVVERRNRTLVEATRTMLIFSKALMFLWAEAMATACYTQNRSLIHTHHNKSPYDLVHNKKPDLTFFRVFGALCYPTNDSKDLRKLQLTADIGIFIGYAPSRKVSTAVASPRVVDPAGSPSSTTVDQDVPSTSTSPTTQEIQSQVTHQGAKE